MLLPPTLSAREVGVACNLDCPHHPIATTGKQKCSPKIISGPPVVERQEVRQGGGGLFGGEGDLARPGNNNNQCLLVHKGKGVLGLATGLYGNVMGDCVTAV